MINDFFRFFFNFNGDSLLSGLIGCFFGLLIIVILLFIFIFICYWIVEQVGFAKAALQSEDGVVTNKYYNAGSVSTSGGTGVGANGQATSVVTVNSKPESFIIEFKLNDDKKYRIETDEDTYDTLETGDKVEAYFKISTTTKCFSWTGEFKKFY